MTEPTFTIDGMEQTYWVQNKMCIYNAFYNTYYLKNEKTHRVRCGELFYKGVQKTDGEVHWKVNDFEYDLSNSHWWVETDDGKVIDWIPRFFGKRDMGVDKKVWTKEELAELGIEYKYYEHEAEIFKKADKMYGGTGKWERAHAE